MFGRDLERWIRDYLSEIDFANENFSIAQIKQDLSKMLDQDPAVQVQRVKYGIVNEATKKVENKEKISIVTVSYIDGETDDGRPIVKRIPLMVA